VDAGGADSQHVLVAALHDNAVKIRVVLPAIPDIEERPPHPQRRNAEDGLRGGVAHLPATSRRVPRKVTLHLLRIDEMEQELSAVLGENEQLLQQRQAQDSEGVWEQRYQ